MSELSAEQIRENYLSVMARLQQAAKAAGRDPDEVKLLTVTKAHPIAVVRAAYQAGARDFGENYVQEALEKMDALSAPDARWHMIGHVQSRKARDVSTHFASLHSLDRLKLARRCERFSSEAERKLPVLLECNVSGEASKFGWPAWDENRWPELVDSLRPLMAFEALEIRGLMTMPPYDPDPEAARPYFQRLRRLQRVLAEQFPQVAWRELSMGMSHDFEVAVQEGATIVRVGTAIVGAR